MRGASQGPPRTTPPSQRALPSAEEAGQACQVLLALKPWCLQRKRPGQSLQHTGAPRPIWDGSIFLAHQITLRSPRLKPVKPTQFYIELNQIHLKPKEEHLLFKNPLVKAVCPVRDHRGGR